ncbi:hypothetical protein K469DRAFT_714372 [Zopfia rhizophila CBS 207.26]|uniref:HCP-like protein n=1 Tax=Zopfia rhizophila CBS 207.26 TaxID=1314779 RepID=A0A6A6DPA4_9PEZI|nr:hypothetical protein K469DRAFT_714372 [Zopfia rhizophila CBS 207.26]
MALRPIIYRSCNFLIKTKPCLFCQTRQFLHQRRDIRPPQSSTFNLDGKNNGKELQRREYSAPGPKTPQAKRNAIDTQNRAKFFDLAKTEGLIVMSPKLADEIIADFLSEYGDGKGSGKTVLELAEKHRLKVTNITELALATSRIPTKGMPGLPQSHHQDISRMLLVACSKAKEPVATLHILTAVFRAPFDEAARNIANIFKPSEIQECRKELEELAYKEGYAEAMTLQGQFLEKEGKKKDAMKLYEEAMGMADIKLKNAPKEGPRIAMPLTPPWNILGNLLLANKDPTAQVRAKEVFKKGALEGDDPLAYYHLASFEEDKQSCNWLQYMSKAAASGHIDAMYQVAHFYLKSQAEEQGQKNVNPDLLEKDNTLTEALNWLNSRDRSMGPIALAIEWFEVAARGGHKPSMMTLVEYFRKSGKIEEALKHLNNVLKPPPKGQKEEWPDLVREAQIMLRHGLE